MGVGVHECCHCWLHFVGIYGHPSELDGKVFGWADSRQLSGISFLVHAVRCGLGMDRDRMVLYVDYVDHEDAITKPHEQEIEE